MKERLSWNDIFKNMVLDVSKRSTCARLQVGAILVKEGRVISMGYNGVTKGEKHCIDHFYDEFKKTNFSSYDDYLSSQEFKDEHHLYSTRKEQHAEQNLISFCSKNGINTNNSELYVTHSPCIHCAKMLYAAGISKVYYIYPYERDMSGVEFLEENNITCELL